MRGQVAVAGRRPDEHAIIRAMKNIQVASFALFLLVACAKNGPAPEPVTPTPTPTETPATAEAPTCESDGDCVVSCARPDDCCNQLCPPCEQVFHKDALAALETWRSGNCAAVSCPVAKCMAPKEEAVGRCTEGHCTIERTPIANP
jgi:hypothetical protein